MSHLSHRQGYSSYCSECAKRNDFFAYKLIGKKKFKNATLLLVNFEYHNNFDGAKLLVFRGNFEPGRALDPHFLESNDLIARFRPDEEGLSLAVDFCERLGA